MTDVDVSEGDVITVTYTNSVTGREEDFRARVTDTEDSYMNSGDGDGFKAKRHSDDMEVGVWPGGDVCTFGFQQSFIGEDASIATLGGETH